MYAEFKSKRVNIFCQRCKALSPCGRWEAVLGRYHPGIFVNAELCKGSVFVGLYIRFVPLDIHGNVFPAVFFQVLCHKIGVLSYYILGNGSAVAVPAVPAHGSGHCFHKIISLPLSNQQSSCSGQPRPRYRLPFRRRHTATWQIHREIQARHGILPARSQSLQGGSGHI